MAEPSPVFQTHREFIVAHCELLFSSFRRVTGRSLGDQPDWAKVSRSAMADLLFHAPFVLASHGTEADPVLNFGNQAALDLWEADWETFTAMPSRLTAEPMRREERAALLEAVTANGFIDDYKGIRITTTGRRFRIDRATVWNVLDDEGEYQGQAVIFSDWEMLG